MGASGTRARPQDGIVQLLYKPVNGEPMEVM